MSPLEAIWYPGKGGRPWREKMPTPRLAHLTPLLMDYIFENKQVPPTIYDQFGRPLESRPGQIDNDDAES